MYAIVKNVLNNGGYDLTAMLKKIDTLWVQGKLTDEEFAELTQRAKDGAKVEYSIDVLAKLEELDKRMLAVENGSVKTETEEYPEFVVGKWYYNGDKVSFEGDNYVCIAPEGTVCVWSPKDYPAYWE
jgi:roadblock/LC7 domain-containing protein